MNVEISIGEALGEGMLQHQQRYQESEAEAHTLDPTHPQMAADVDRPEGQREVDRERTVEHHGADPTAPDHFRRHSALLHRLEGDVAQAVIEKMQEHIGKQNEAAGQPELAHDRRPAAHQPRPAGFPRQHQAAPSTLRHSSRNAATRGLQMAIYLQYRSRLAKIPALMPIT